MFMDRPDQLIQDFLHFVNGFYPSIQFTLEVGDGKINLLDLTISLLLDSFSIDIYRVPAATNLL